MNLNIQDEAVRGAVIKAVMESMNPELTTKLIEDALKKFLNEPDGSRYGTKRTKLEETFTYAVDQVAREAILEKLNSDGALKAQITGVVSDAIEKAFSDERRDDMVQAMVVAVGKAFRAPDRY